MGGRRRSVRFRTGGCAGADGGLEKWGDFYLPFSTEQVGAFKVPDELMEF